MSEPRSQRAAQYLRMSTDTQHISIGLQSAANAAYAKRAGYDIVKTYADPGVSGLTLSKRPGLKRLLAEVVAGEVDFGVILVFDVSRWGRFQDPDEAAHYEFLCRSAGLAIEYTTEVFANDDSLPSTLVKQLKRLMAAEYSRDLSAKIRHVHQHLHAQGFFSGGAVPYGFVRQQVGPDRRIQKELRRFERKSYAASRIVLAPGPAEEVRVVRRIFRDFVSGQRTTAQISRRLAAEGVTTRGGRPWSPGPLRKLLSNELYAGTTVLGRERYVLNRRVERVPETRWRRKRGAVKAIVPHQMWVAAQAYLALGHSAHVADETLLVALSALHRRHGCLSARVIAADGGHPVGLYRSRFGSLTQAYVKAGLGRTARQCRARLRGRRSRESYLRNPSLSDAQILDALRALFVREGRLCTRLIDAAADCPNTPAVRARFGGLRLAFALVGYRPSHYQDLQMEARGQAVTCDEATLIRARVAAGEEPTAIAAGLARRT